MKHNLIKLNTLCVLSTIALSACNSGGGVQPHVNARALNIGSIDTIEVNSKDLVRNLIPMLTSQYDVTDKNIGNNGATGTSCSGTIVNSQDRKQTYLVTALHCIDKEDYDKRFLNQNGESYTFTLKKLDIILPIMRFSAVHDYYFANDCFPSPGVGFDWGLDNLPQSFTLLTCPTYKSSGDKKPSSYGFLPSNDAIYNFGTQNIDKLYIHVSENGKNPDIAIIKLKDNSGFISDMVSVNIGGNGSDNLKNKGNPYIYGWSTNLAADSYEKSKPGRLRQVPLDNSFVNNIKQNDNFIDVKPYTKNKSLTFSPGDSGGPILQKDAQGNYYLLGVNSYCNTDTGNYVTNVSKYKEWINDIISEKIPKNITITCEIDKPCTI